MHQCDSHGFPYVACSWGMTISFVVNVAAYISSAVIVVAQPADGRLAAAGDERTITRVTQDVLRHSSQQRRDSCRVPRRQMRWI